MRFRDRLRLLTTPDDLITAVALALCTDKQLAAEQKRRRRAAARRRHPSAQAVTVR